LLETVALPNSMPLVFKPAGGVIFTSKAFCTPFVAPSINSPAVCPATSPALLIFSFIEFDEQAAKHITVAATSIFFMLFFC